MSSLDKGKQNTRGGHKRRVTCVGWNCTGLWLATGSTDKIVIIHQHDSERELLNSKKAKNEIRLKHAAGIQKVLWSPTEEMVLIVSTDDNMLFVWDLAKSAKTARNSYRLGSYASHVAFTSNGLYMAVILQKSGQEDTILFLSREKPKTTVQRGFGCRLSEVVFANEDRYLMFTHDSKVQILDIQDITNIQQSLTFSVSSGQVKTIDIDRTQTFFVTGGSDGVVSFWSTENLTCEASLTFSDRVCAITKVRISHDSSLVAVAGDDQKITMSATDKLYPIGTIHHRCSSLSMAWNPRFLILAYTCAPSSNDYHHDRYERRDREEVCRLWAPPVRN